MLSIFDAPFCSVAISAFTFSWFCPNKVHATVIVLSVASDISTTGSGWGVGVGVACKTIQPSTEILPSSDPFCLFQINN